MRQIKWFFASLAVIALLALGASAGQAIALSNIPGGIYKGRVPVGLVEINGSFGDQIGSTSVSLRVTHSVVSDLRIGPTPVECGGRKLKTPRLSGFPKVNLKKQKLFNPDDALLSVSFTQTPLNASGSNPWVLSGVPEEGSGLVALSGRFITEPFSGISFFEGEPGGFELFFSTNSKGEFGPPGPDGVYNPCQVRAETFGLKRVGVRHHGHHKRRVA